MFVHRTNVELGIEREDRALQRDAIADFPSESFHQLRSDDRSLPIIRKRFEIGRTHGVIIEHGRHVTVIDREIGEEIFLLLVVRAEPLHLTDIDDAGNLANLHFMRHWKCVREGDRRLHRKAVLASPGFREEREVFQNREQRGDEEENRRHQQYGEQRSKLVAKYVAQNELRKSHASALAEIVSIPSPAISTR